jgi:hypothetical protein
MTALEGADVLALLASARRAVFFLEHLSGAEDKMSSTDSKITKIQTHFKTLSSVAPALNTASDELSKAIRSLDQSLKKLNVGLSVWVSFADHTDEPGDGSYNLEQIGYTKVSGEWGLALRHIWGHEAFDSHSQEGPWLFTDAPRDMRIRSIDKIPEVVEQLGNEAIQTTKKMQQRTIEVRDLASAIEQIGNSQPDPKSLTSYQGALAAIIGTTKAGDK